MNLHLYDNIIQVFEIIKLDMEAKQTPNPPFSLLNQYYENSIVDKQNHFRKQWLRFFGLKRGQFYERLKKPQVLDYILWQNVCDDLIFSDRVISIFETVYKKELETVEKYTMPTPKFYETQFSTII